jgi:allophanate hydrolase subunit 1
MEGCQVKRRIEKVLRSVKFDLNISHNPEYFNSLQQQILGTEGVVEVDIDKGSQKLFIDFDPEKTTQQEIERRVKKYI